MRLDGRTRDALFILRGRIRERAKHNHQLAKDHSDLITVTPLEADQVTYGVVAISYGIAGKTLDGLAEDIVNTITEMEK